MVIYVCFFWVLGTTGKVTYVFFKMVLDMCFFLKWLWICLFFSRFFLWVWKLFWPKSYQNRKTIVNFSSFWLKTIDSGDLGGKSIKIKNRI